MDDVKWERPKSAIEAGIEAQKRQEAEARAARERSRKAGTAAMEDPFVPEILGRNRAASAIKGVLFDSEGRWRDVEEEQRQARLRGESGGKPVKSKEKPSETVTKEQLAEAITKAVMDPDPPALSPQGQQLKDQIIKSIDEKLPALGLRR